MLTGMTMVSGHSTIYTYDSLQRLTQRHINSGKAGGGMWDCYSYKDGSATNTTTTRVHSKENWLNSSIRTNSLFFEYDVIGNITKETRHTYSIPASSKIAQNVADRTVSTIHYTYDALGQLTGVTHSDGRTEAYTYDKAGNILTFNNGSGISHNMAYTDSQWKDLLTAVGTQTITYDAIGNPINYYNGYTFTWAEGRRLQSVTQNGQTHSYQYNADGLRIKKTNPDGTYIVYHIADGRYVGETHYNELNHRVKYLRYTYDENDRVCGIGVWYAGQSQAWEEYYFETNLQGDVIAVYTAANGTNELPQLVASYTYDAWGNILTSTGSLADLNPFRYRGYYYDAETEFYYLRSRYYNPEIGRFLNADDYVSTGQGISGFNMYAYCGNNPANYHDTSGTRYEISIGGGAPSSNGLIYETSSSPKGELYEHWSDSNGTKVWSRHHSDHGNPKKHTNPHDHSWDEDEDGHNKPGPPIPPNPNFQSPNSNTTNEDHTNKMIGRITETATIGIFVYIGVKWVAAACLAPTTGGGSLIVAGAIP